MRQTNRWTNARRYVAARGRSGVQAASRIGRAHSAGWIGTGVPLVTCIAVWGVGDAPAVQASWLPILHGVIFAAASVWTIFQLALKGLRV
jgi:hypothetical protein